MLFILHDLIQSSTVIRIKMKLPGTVLREWVIAANAGHETSWKILYAHFYPAMYAIAIGICRNTDVAADRVQDAFITAYLKLSQLNDPERFGAWLKQIVIHKCYRSNYDHQRFVSLEALSHERDWKDDTDKVQEDVCRHRHLSDLLATLPAALNSTVLLRYFSGFQSYEQIAAILQIPIGTVRSRLSQAKKILRDHWQKHPETDASYHQGSEEWNGCYADWYGGMHAHDKCKSAFVRHVAGADVVLPTGKRWAGKLIFEQMVREDRQVGSWLQPVNIVSSGNISIIESRHFNSPTHPHHCPTHSILVIFRQGGKASRLFVHTAEK
jgi:RNA polymerase sigma-70 factor (ECF subfamily)